MNHANSYRLTSLRSGRDSDKTESGVLCNDSLSTPSPDVSFRKRHQNSFNSNGYPSSLQPGLIGYTNEKFESLSTSGYNEDVDVEPEYHEDNTKILHTAVASFNQEALLQELQRPRENLEINGIDSQGYTALHIAARLDNTDAAAALIQSGASIDCKSVDGDSPIHTCIRHQSHGVLKVLMDSGASLTIPTMLGATPLHLACGKKDHHSVGELLSKTTKNINVGDKFGMLPIHYAALAGDTMVGMMLLACGAFATERASLGETPLILAAGENNIEIMKLLINNVRGSEDSGTSLSDYINMKMNDGTSALHWAALLGNVEALSLLIENGASLNELCAARMSPLHLAASSSNSNVVRQLISTGALLELQDDFGRTPLHLAVLSGTEESTKHLIEAGANINCKTINGKTPIFLAAMKGRADIVKTLIEGGASLVLEDSEQKTCLHHAVTHGDISIIEQLVSASSFLMNTAKDAIGRSPMHYAAFLDRPKVLGILLAKSSMRGIVDFYGKTPLHLAAEKGALKCIEILLEEASADVKNACDAKGNTALHSATYYGHSDVCRILLASGLSVNPANNDGQTPLHLSSNEQGCGKVMKELLSSNANTEIKDKNGDTPLIVAVKQNNTIAVHLLLDNGASLTTLNTIGQNALEAAIDTGQEDAASIILHHERWQEALGFDNYRQQILMNKLVEIMPSACLHVLDKCVTFSDHHSDHPDLKFTFNFTYLEPTTDVSKEKRLHDLIPTKMVKFQREDLLLHPLTTKYLECKWRTIGRHVYYVSFLLYLFYLVTMTYLIVVERDRSIQEFVFEQNKNTTMPITGSTNQSMLIGSTPTPTLQRKRRMVPPDGGAQPLTNSSTVGQESTTPSSSGGVAPTQAGGVTSQGPTNTPLAGTNSSSMPSRNFSGGIQINTGQNAVGSSQQQATVVSTPPPRPSEGMAGKVLGAMTLAFSIVMLIKEFFQMYLIRLKYFYDFTNYLELLLYGFSIVYLSDFLFKLGWRDQNKYQLGVLSLFFIYMNLLLYLQRVAMFKLHVVMFTQVVQTLLRVFAVFSVAILGFALTFYQMFPKQKTYSTLPRAIVKVLVMLTGELDYDSSITSNIGQVDSDSKYPLVPFTDLAYLVVVVFLLILALGLVNLLVGLAVGDIQAIRRHARMEVERQNVAFAQDIFHSVPKRIYNKLWTLSVDAYPNKDTLIKKLLTRLNAGDEDESQSMMTRIQGRSRNLATKSKTNEMKGKIKSRLENVERLVQSQNTLLLKVAEKLNCLN